MNGQEQGIICLLRSAITGESLVLPEGFDLEESYSMLSRHQIVPMAYVGAVHCGISKKLPVMQKMFREYCRQMLRSEKQMAAIESLYAAFDQNKIDYMPVKGCNIKLLYPKPEMRPMGDADILIRVDQYEKICAVMEQLGYEKGEETDHELIWHTPNLYVELHKRLIPSYNRDYCRYYGDGWKMAKRREGTHHFMTAEDAFIYLLTHFAKHYRDGGIGCRHLTDLWVFLRANPGLQEAYLEEELKKLDLITFYRNIRRTIEAWFCDGQWDGITEHITQFLFASGSWGNLESHAVSSGVRQASATGSEKKGKLQWLLELLFPSREILAYKYPVVTRLPVLVPFVWVVRWIFTLLFRGDVVRNRYKSLELSTSEKVTSFRQALEYVGLKFE